MALNVALIDRILKRWYEPAVRLQRATGVWIWLRLDIDTQLARESGADHVTFEIRP